VRVANCRHIGISKIECATAAGILKYVAANIKEGNAECEVKSIKPVKTVKPTFGERFAARFVNILKKIF